MTNERWRPALTVAAVIERDDHFLLVAEETAEGVRFNQPAGHVEAGESPAQAVVREVWEETRYRFTPLAVIGAYLWQRPSGKEAFLRFAFCGKVSDAPEPGALDAGILHTVWLTRDEVAELAAQGRTRSPLVLAVIDDWLNGRRYSMDVVRLWRESNGLMV